MVIILPEPPKEAVNVTALTWLPPAALGAPYKKGMETKKPRVLVLTNLVASYYLLQTYCSGVARN